MQQAHEMAYGLLECGANRAVCSKHADFDERILLCSLLRPNSTRRHHLGMALPSDLRTMPREVSCFPRGVKRSQGADSEAMR